MHECDLRAQLGPLDIPCSGMCAERRLIRRLMLLATRRGVASYRLATWTRRCLGAVFVSRRVKDGALACALPCVMCEKAMCRLGLSWKATLGPDGSTCKNDDPDRPKCKPTHSQLNRWGANT
jgi:hypothetical protein